MVKAKRGAALNTCMFGILALIHAERNATASRKTAKCGTEIESKFIDENFKILSFRILKSMF